MGCSAASDEVGGTPSSAANRLSAADSMAEVIALKSNIEELVAPDGVDNRSVANGSGAAVDWVAEVLAVCLGESLEKKVGVDSLETSMDTSAKPVRSGSFRIDRCDDSLFSLAVNRFDDMSALLLGFEPTAVEAVAEVLSKIGREEPVTTLAVLDAYPGVPKYEVNIMLNKGV